jgi:hypothetical protein
MLVSLLESPCLGGSTYVRQTPAHTHTHTHALVAAHSFEYPGLQSLCQHTWGEHSFLPVTCSTCSEVRHCCHRVCYCLSVRCHSECDALSMLNVSRQP